MKNTIFAAIALLFLNCALRAEQANTSDAVAQNAAMEQRIRELEDRVIALEGKIRTMQSEQAAQAPTAQPVSPAETAQPAQAGNAGPGAPSQAPSVPVPAPPSETQAGLANAGAQLPVYGGSAAAAKALNPDISVIGDFVGAAGGNTAPPLATLQPFPSLQMHESEIGLQAIIDPYARGDFLSRLERRESISRKVT